MLVDKKEESPKEPEPETSAQSATHLATLSPNVGGTPPTFFKIPKIQFRTPPNGPLDFADPYFRTIKSICGPLFSDPCFCHIFGPLFFPFDICAKTPKKARFFGPLFSDPYLCHFFGPLAESCSKSAADPYFRTPSRSQNQIRTPIFGPLGVRKSICGPLFSDP